METDDYIPLSYISQYNYCPRRAGLLMNEQLWEENSDTAKGRNEHSHVHTTAMEKNHNIITFTDLYVDSKELKLAGKCDAVQAIPDADGFIIPDLCNEKCILFPVEYKHGKLRNEIEYELQLTAQAICLEEIYNCHIEKGSLFYISSHRNYDVYFDGEKRKQVVSSAYALCEMQNSGITPKAIKSSKCAKCSMKDLCLPEMPDSTHNYIKGIYKDFRKDL